MSDARMEKTPSCFAEAAEIRLHEAGATDAIERQSFAIIEAEIPEPRPFSGAAWQIARRIAHAGGDISLVDSLWLPDSSIEAGILAIQTGAPVFTDTQMALAGLSMQRLENFGCTASCVLAQPGLAEPAMRRGTTRSRLGMERLGHSLGGAVVAIGNAPTALLALLDLLGNGGPAPALIIGMPVGFVNAAESKELLLQWQQKTGQPCLALRGRRGGSPLVAAAVNALALLATEPRCA